MASALLLHPFGPSEESREIAAMLPQESPEIGEADPIGLNSPVSFHAPAQVWASPGTEAIAPGGAPEKAQH